MQFFFLFESLFFPPHFQLLGNNEYGTAVQAALNRIFSWATTVAPSTIPPKAPPPLLPPHYRTQLAKCAGPRVVHLRVGDGHRESQMGHTRVDTLLPAR